MVSLYEVRWDIEFVVSVGITVESIIGHKKFLLSPVRLVRSEYSNGLRQFGPFHFHRVWLCCVALEVPYRRNVLRHMPRHYH